MNRVRVLNAFGGILLLCLAGPTAAQPSATRPSEVFEPMWKWSYRCAPRPSPNSDEVKRMVAFYEGHREDPEAEYWVGMAEAIGVAKVDRTPAELISAAAKRGYPPAMARMGYATVAGDGVPVDREGGMAMIRAAYKAGGSDGALELGEVIVKGFDNTSGLDAAERYLKEAIDKGNLRGHYTLAQLYQMRGDRAAAVRELTVGADAGDEHAIEMLAAVYKDGKLGVAIDPPKALYWMKKGAEIGKPSMQRELVKMIQAGYGGITPTADNFAVARRLLEKAAGSRDSEAVCLLAKCYLSGELGFPYEPRRGVGMLEGAAGRRDPAASYELGRLYVEGLEVPRDLARAKELMVGASAAGYKPATAYLRRMESAATRPVGAVDGEWRELGRNPFSGTQLGSR